MAAPKPAVRVERTAFRSSRALDFASVEELTRETGQPPAAWPLVILKELVDNALDACEEAGIAPVILVRVDQDGITVTDNGPGLPAETVAGVVDFQVRVSSRSAYVAPDRGAQGNALKTLIAMPFVLDGTAGQVGITARGLRHRITFGLDALRQHPEVALEAEPAPAVRRGTSVLVRWPDSAKLNPDRRRGRFLPNRRHLRLPEPAPDPHAPLVRAGGRMAPGGTNVGEVEADAADLAALVHARAAGAADRRLPRP
jgi:hypothetical protein